MFFVSIISVIDRGILTPVVDPLRRDLAISDVQMNLLLGLAFGIFYAIAGIPLGLLADRVSQRKLLFAGITIWSGATFLGAFAASFDQLFTSRLLVGLGEAALALCAVSMIANMFPPQKRGRPISIYLLGSQLPADFRCWLPGQSSARCPRASWRGSAGLTDWRRGEWHSSSPESQGCR